MKAREGEQRPLMPVYLSGVLTVEAELSAGRLYDGSAHAENASRVLVALVFTGGAAMLFTEDESGQLTRLRIPGPGFLRLTDDVAGKLARSRQRPARPARRQVILRTSCGSTWVGSSGPTPGLRGGAIATCCGPAGMCRAVGRGR